MRLGDGYDFLTAFVRGPLTCQYQVKGSLIPIQYEFIAGDLVHDYLCLYVSKKISLDLKKSRNSIRAFSFDVPLSRKERSSPSVRDLNISSPYNYRYHTS